MMESSQRDALIDEIMKELLNEQSSVSDVRLGEKALVFRPGEVTLWAGYSGAGKSTLVSQIMAKFAFQGIKGFFVGLETPPAVTLAKMCKQITGRPFPKREEVRQVLTKLFLTIHVPLGTADPTRIIKEVRQEAGKGAGQIAIDSLTRVVSPNKGNVSAQEFVAAMAEIAEEFRTHIHIVNHVKKKEDEAVIPLAEDILFANDVNSQVDNILILWRNKIKEKIKTKRARKAKENEGDAILLCEKQKRRDWDEETHLFYSPYSNIFTCNSESV